MYTDGKKGYIEFVISPISLYDRLDDGLKKAFLVHIINRLKSMAQYLVSSRLYTTTLNKKSLRA